MRLFIKNMNCGGCARGVTAIIQDVDPHATVSIELSTKVVSVETQASIEQVTAALAGGGFPPQVA